MKLKILGLLAAGLLAGPMAAHAVTITVAGNAYEISTVTGSYTDNQSTLKAQAWWGESDLAKAFAVALSTGLGYPNVFAGAGNYGPIFAYSDDVVTGLNFNWSGWNLREGFWVISAQGPVAQTGLVFATARQVAAVPEPGSLALLGLGLAGLGLSRRRTTS